jgi:hypothetical protein
MPITPEQSQKILTFLTDKAFTTNFTINPDTHEIDVDGDVYLDEEGLTDLPYKFNNVSGNFCINDNKLTSLKNFPNIVKGVVKCSNNLITSLEYIPKYIGSRFIINDNKITSLDYLHDDIYGPIEIQDNLITDINIPIIKNSIYIHGNPIQSINSKLRGKIITFTLSEYITIANMFDKIKTATVVMIYIPNEYNVIGIPRLMLLPNIAEVIFMYDTAFHPNLEKVSNILNDHIKKKLSASHFQIELIDVGLGEYAEM